MGDNRIIINMEKIFKEYARNELTEHIVYHKLAEREKNPANREALERMSTQEGSHHEFWKSLLPANTEIKPYPSGLIIFPLLRTFLGVTFTAKLLESHEKDAVAKYQAVFPHVPKEHQARFEEIINDEKSHELSLIGQVKERRVAYIGFVALGLADAIVEITGTHAGFLGVTGSTLIAGVSGIIVGFAAAISMGSAAYLQAKQDPERSPIVSAVITGVSYLFAVICLALPYFLIRTMLTAFVTSTCVGLLLLAGFTYYGAIVFERKFITEFSESAFLMLGTALATYVLGTIVGKVFDLNASKF